MTCILFCMSIKFGKTKTTPALRQNQVYLYYMESVQFYIFLFFPIFVFHALDLKPQSIPLTDFWLDIFFSGIQVSFVALPASHTPLLPGLWPSGQAAYSFIFPPTANQCTVSPPASHCHRRVQLSEPAMLAAFNISPWGFEISFLW